jgi:hypothetical protein
MSLPDDGGRSEEAGRVYTTTDLPLMAYFIMNGITLVKATRRHENGSQDFVFHYLDPEGRTEQLSVDYLSSKAYLFDAAVRSLKKLCNAQRGRRRRRGRRR